MFLILEEITTEIAFVSEVTLRFFSISQAVVTFRASAENFDNPIPRQLLWGVLALFLFFISSIVVLPILPYTL